jgi:hypothetical protein
LEQAWRNKHESSYYQFPYHRPDIAGIISRGKKAKILEAFPKLQLLGNAYF